MSSNAGISPGHAVTSSPIIPAPFPLPPTIDVYLATTGNDANNGLTPLTPVLTLAGAYSKIPSNATLAVIHVASGTYAWTPLPFALTILGDGAGQPGDTGFTTVATGVSAAGTNATNLTLAAPVAVNLYRGLTLEWRSGAANGHRLSVRDNTATVVTPVEVAGYPTSVIDPGVGSDFAIIRPAVIFTTTAVEVSGTVQIIDSISSSREYHPVALINVRLTMSSATVRGIIASARARLFGVEVNPGILSLVDAQVDGGFVLPEAAMNEWAIRVGLAGFAQITNWIGWGLTWPAALLTEGSVLLGAGCVLRGMLVVGGMSPNSTDVSGLTQSGTIEIHGGSALGDINLFRVTWLQGNNNIAITCRSFLMSISYALTRRMSCDGGNAVIPLRVETNSMLDMMGNFSAINANAFGANILRNSQVLMRGAATNVFGGGSSTVGMSVDQSRVVVNNASCAFTGTTNGLVLSGGSTFISETSAAMTCTGTTIAAQPGLDIFEGSSFVGEAATVLNATGVGGGARVRQNSNLTLLNATFTLAASTSGSGVACSGGSSCYFPGGAGNTITGLGAGNFGVTCRGGGRAFFLNAPPATVTGPGGDLTVGPGGGDTIASAALAASLSAVVAGASAIARAS
jgi:hypothetical protein